MKNAIKYGIVIGFLSGFWILMMHFAGIYDPGYWRSNSNNIGWLEFTSLVIPAIGLYLGIKNMRNQINKGKMNFFEGILEGFKIMLIGGIISGIFAAIYIQYSQIVLNTDFMARIAALGIVGILFDIGISLLLMTTPKQL